MLEQKLEDANRKLQAARDVAESASGLAKEQAEKRARGRSVKISDRTPWHSRFTWVNHEHTVALRQKQREEKLAEEQKEREKQQKPLTVPSVRT